MTKTYATGSGEEAVVLHLNECAALYPRFKARERLLAEDERLVLLKIEKALYESFSIKEMEELLKKGSIHFNAAKEKKL